MNPLQVSQAAGQPLHFLLLALSLTTPCEHFPHLAQSATPVITPTPTTPQPPPSCPPPNASQLPSTACQPPQLPHPQALAQAGLEKGNEAFEKLDKTRCGVLVGSGMGGLTVFQDGELDIWFFGGVGVEGVGGHGLGGGRGCRG